MDRRTSRIDPDNADDEVSAAKNAPAPLEDGELDRLFPPIDEDDPEWQAYVRRKVRESLDDPRPDLTAEEVRESLRAHHEERLRRGP